MASVEQTIQWLKDKKIKSLATTTSGAESYTKADFKKANAIILGSEAQGLSQKWLKEADDLIKIPMKKGLDSLNVSVSAAVILFEALRQKGSV